MPESDGWRLTRRRKLAFAAVCGAVVWWTAVSTLVWGGVKLQRNPRGFARVISMAVALPVVTTTWPAHELALEATGRPGVVSRPSVSPLSALFYTLWAVALWLPAMIACRTKDWWIGAMVQGAVLAGLFGTFWRYGNE